MYFSMPFIWKQLNQGEFWKDLVFHIILSHVQKLEEKFFLILFYVHGCLTCIYDYVSYSYTKEATRKCWVLGILELGLQRAVSCHEHCGS